MVQQLKQYFARFTKVFPAALDGLSLALDEHLSVGRDIMATLLEKLGAKVVRTGGSDTFVPIDIENINIG
jgi:phosphomannomutase